MKQTRLESLIETNTNIAIGFVVALTFWTFVIVPVYELPVSFIQNIEITGWFTLLAIARGYVVRRVFNAGLHRIAHQMAAKVLKPKQKWGPLYGFEIPKRRNCNEQDPFLRLQHKSSWIESEETHHMFVCPMCREPHMLNSKGEILEIKLNERSVYQVDL